MKTLVVYSSKYGATRFCAECITKGVRGEVRLINLREETPSTIDEYDKIIIGSPIYAGMLRKEIKKFYEAYQETLMGKKVAVFLSCMDGEKTDEYLKGAFSETFIKKLIAKGNCGGAFYFKKMNFLERFIIKKINESKRGLEEKQSTVNTKEDIEMFIEENIKQFIEQVNR